METAEQLYPDIGSKRACDYVYKVLYGVAIEYLNSHLFLKLMENSRFEYQHFIEDDPYIKLLSPEWQQEQCKHLNIPYICELEQHNNIAGQKLKYFIPARCEAIVGDGNCLFRCLSKIISGSEDYHLQIRAECCRYMVSEGISTIGWYFKQLNYTTPFNYIKNSGMLDESIWGSDVELIALSAMLKTDIYVANRNYTTTNSYVPEIRWSRIRSSNDNDSTFAIFISNYFNHYEPVIRLINSLTFPTQTTPMNKF